MNKSHLADHKIFTKHSFRLGKGARKFAYLSLALGFLNGNSANAALDLSYLQGLLAATPEGGWVQVNTNKFSFDAFVFELAEMFSIEYT